MAALSLALGSALSPAAAQEGRGAQQDSAPAVPVRTEPAGASLLDAPVSRTAYLLGPGDGVDVAVFGDFNRVYTVTVGPEGSLLVPGVGMTNVLGLNLNQAQDRVRDLVYRYYRNVDVRLSLSRVRSFKVFVVGAVREPGIRVATSATRVSELASDAEATDVAAVKRRNIVLRRASGDSLRVDLARFLQMGDLSANPTLREGDAVIVPEIDETITVYGRVAFPGTYEYRSGESLADLLAVANGGGSLPSNAADSIRVTRLAENARREFYVLSRAEALGPEGQRFVLQPFDAVFVPEVRNYRKQKVATILGEVRRPGTYPIRADTTTVRELVELAGGFTPEASLARATLRRSTDSPPLRSRSGDREGEPVVPPEVLSRDEQQILWIRSQSDQNHVVVDFQKLFAQGEDAYDQTLQAGDSLLVPPRRDDVVVLGAVAAPGIVPYRPSQGVGYFVGLAGGFGGRADRGAVTVLKARLGSRVAARDVTSIEPGDQIIVPFKERRTFMEQAQTASGFVATIGSAVLGVYGIVRLLTDESNP